MDQHKEPYQKVHIHNFMETSRTKWENGWAELKKHSPLLHSLLKVSELLPLLRHVDGDFNLLGIPHNEFWIGNDDSKWCMFRDGYAQYRLAKGSRKICTFDIGTIIKLRRKISGMSINIDCEIEEIHYITPSFGVCGLKLLKINI